MHHLPGALSASLLQELTLTDLAVLSMGHAGSNDIGDSNAGSNVIGSSNQASNMFGNNNAAWAW